MAENAQCCSRVIRSSWSDVSSRQGTRRRLRVRRGGAERRRPGRLQRQGPMFTSCRRSTPPGFATADTHRFSEELQALGVMAAAYTVSLDLPFAQQRWCTEAKVENLRPFRRPRPQPSANATACFITGLPNPAAGPRRVRVDPRTRYVTRRSSRDRLGARLRARAEGTQRGGGA